MTIRCSLPVAILLVLAFQTGSIAEEPTPLIPAAIATDPLDPGDHLRMLTVDQLKRNYLVHVPKSYDCKQPTPVVLALHGAAMNGSMMVWFSGLSEKSEDAGFLVVYPSGTGIGPCRIWNAGGFSGTLAEGTADDVKYVGAVLDDLATVANVDTKRIFATGISNGGMMCYRLAAEMSDRIAAIAPVAGAMAIDQCQPTRPVSVMHFHGKSDKLVTLRGPNQNLPQFLKFKSVPDSIAIWRKINECPDAPATSECSDKADDGTKVTRKSYGPGKDGAEVVLIEIEGGGHTWPGMKPPIDLMGKSTFDISANDLMWEFFLKHPMR